MTFEQHTEVVIIGNGPAGISLSAFLNGWHPYYDNKKPHPDSFIDENLRAFEDKSLLDQDFSWYESEFETRGIPSVSLYSDLYDRLMRPEAASSDVLNNYKASCLQYKYETERLVDHVVLGDGPVGGSWNKYDDNMATVSLTSWMDLPVFSLNDWMGGRPLLARLPAGVIREYMHEYVDIMGIKDRFLEFTTVTNVTKFCSDSDQKEYWRVRGHFGNSTPFEITCKRVVLACGRNHHRRLEVEGEENSMNVVYNVCEMEQLLRQQEDFSKTNVSNQNVSASVVVVGDGISAADAIRNCLANQIPVVHVFKRTEKQLKGTMLSRLSATVYPEYSKVFDLMVERITDPLYHRADSCSIDAINSNLTVCLKCQKTGKIEFLAYRCLCICVGLQTELSMLEENHNFGTNYQSHQDPTLYAVGSAIGDHFVRYLIGGAFHVAQNLLHEFYDTPNVSNLYFHKSLYSDDCNQKANSEVSSSSESINMSYCQAANVDVDYSESLFNLFPCESRPRPFSLLFLPLGRIIESYRKKLHDQRDLISSPRSSLC